MYSKNIEDFLNFIRMAEATNKEDLESQKLCDFETQDILHELELFPHNGVDMMKLTKSLRVIRQKRRDIKDRTTEAEPILAWAEKHKGVINELKQVLGEVRKREQGHVNRAYMYRTDVVQKALEK